MACRSSSLNRACRWHVILLSAIFLLLSGCNHAADGPAAAVGETAPAGTATADGTSAGQAASKPRSLDGATLVSQGIRRHALLVGCSDYEYLDEWVQLRGPANDVGLMRQMLIDRFEFDPKTDDIVTLSAGGNAGHEPTRANIEREFLRLGNSVQAGEPVVILMGGHGSQQPDNDPDNPDDFEPDGRDEIFLPSDVKKWNDQQATVENAIVDDDLRRWLAKIVGRGAFVWLIMDACHSGSGVRGSESEISRQIPPGRLVPSEAFVDVEFSADSSMDTGIDSTLFSTEGEGGLVAIYAAQPHETTPERRLPLSVDRDARKYYGLLTYTICEILTSTHRNLTYNELVHAVQTRYIAMGRRAPTPLIEGSHRDNLVLGRDALPERSRFLLERNGSKNLRINAGSLQGITNGSILAVYPPSGSESAAEPKPVGHVTVVGAELTGAVVKACEYNDLPANEELPNRGRCEIVYEDFGPLQLRVAVDSADADEEPISDAVRGKIIADLQSESSKIVSIVLGTDDADWLARWDSGDVLLVPATGLSRRDLAGHQKSLPTIRLAPGWSAEAIEMLEIVARAQNLLRLTTVASGSMKNSDMGFEMNIIDLCEYNSLEWQTSGLTVRDGQRLRVELKNSGNQSLDVTLLYVDSAYGIACLYPNFGEGNRLDRGDQQRIDLNINADTTGLENLVAIVVRGQRQPVDFSILEQPSIQTGRTRGFEDDALSTPLGELFRSAMYGEGATRGVDKTRVQDYGVTVVSWRIEP